VIDTEASLKCDGVTFRLPIQVASRPWESDESVPSQFLVIDPKVFIVMDFLVDARLNAPANIDQLRTSLRRGAQLVFSVRGIGGGVVSERSFQGSLP
jgi:hypothetical protein